jgi:bacteriorhodopsin
MAELHVQAKKNTSSTWLWILISLIIIAAIVVYLMMRDNGANERSVSKPNQTSSIVYTHEVGLI